MGIGHFDDGRFNFVVSADFAWDAAKKAEWQAAFIQASRALYDATEGQMRFGNIFMCDEGWGISTADAILHGLQGRAFATLGGFGVYGETAHLFDETTDLDGHKIIVHEFGHHLFGLRDEYTQEVLSDQVDTAVTPPGQQFVPIEDSPHVGLIVNATAFMLFGATIETRIVVSHTATMLQVNAGFNQPPAQATPPRVTYQRSARCGAQAAGLDYCIMDDQNVHGEFCTAFNHDPDGDTSQSAAYDGKSCWEVIAETMADRWGVAITQPSPEGEAGPVTDTFPLFFDLEKEHRVVLAVDRSGSMNETGKIEGARFGVEFWLRYAGLHNDQYEPAVTDRFKLGVLWYGYEAESVLDLAALETGPDLEGTIELVNNVPPGGMTNIRDALYAARDMIEADTGRAAVQAVVLLTDGVHNWPPDSDALEVIPALQEAGIQVFTIAVGAPDNVDLALLEEIATATGGLAVTTAVGQTPAGTSGAIGATCAQILDDMMGGIVLDADGMIGPAPPDDPVYGRFKDYIGRRRQPGLRELARYLGARDATALAKDPRVFVRRALVEEDAQALSAQLFHGAEGIAWLYLIDPEGTEEEAAGFVAQGRNATRRVAKPRPGWWTVLAVRATPGPALPVRLLAGVQNRRLSAFGSMTREAPVDGALRLTAGATWRDRLANLRVTARITAPDGSVRNVALHDDDPDEPMSGAYSGAVAADQPGRWTGEITIAGSSRAILAGPVHRISHGRREKEEKLDLAAGTSAFVRRIPVYADVGGRPKVRDLDRTKYPPPKVDRPTIRRLDPLDIEDALGRVPKR